MPAGDEEDRDQEAVADRLELEPELRVGGGVPVEQPDQRAGEERAEDALQADLSASTTKATSSSIARADPDLRGAVLQPHQHVAEPHRSATRRRPRRRDRDDEQHEQRRAGAAARPCLRRRSRTAATAAARRRSRPPTPRRPPSGRAGVSSSAGVLEHGHDQPERRRRQGDGEQQRVVDPADRAERRAGEPADGHETDVADDRDAAAAGPRRLRTSISRPARNSSIARPSSATTWTARSASSQPRADGPDDDAEHDLQHDRRHPEPRREARAASGRDDRDDQDAEQVDELDVRHGRLLTAAPRPARRRAAPGPSVANSAAIASAARGGRSP